MTEWWQPALAVGGGLLLVWLALVALLLWEGRRHPDRVTLRELLRLAPDVARLIKWLVTDRTVHKGVRVILVVLLAYLVSPIDLIPDFIPVIGYADDAIIVALALRFAARRAGRDALERHWLGTPETLQLLFRLAGIASTPS